MSIRDCIDTAVSAGEMDARRDELAIKSFWKNKIELRDPDKVGAMQSNEGSPLPVRPESGSVPERLVEVADRSLPHNANEWEVPLGLEIDADLRGKNIIGADISEVAPCYDPTGITCVTAANLMFEILCVISDAVNPGGD